MKIQPPIRSDAAGDGKFGASRGDRTHVGVDFECAPGSLVESPCSGVVSKIGYPYTPDPADPITYRYVEITDGDAERHRLFYCVPHGIDVDDPVVEGQIVAEVQDIAARYPGQGMKNHYHYEIKRLDDSYRDPTEEP